MAEPHEFFPEFTSDRLSRVAGLAVAVLEHREASSVLCDSLADPCVVRLDSHLSVGRAFSKAADHWPWLSAISPHRMQYSLGVQGTTLDIEILSKGDRPKRRRAPAELGTQYLPGIPREMLGVRENSAYLLLKAEQGRFVPILQWITDDEAATVMEREIVPEAMTYADAEAPGGLPPLTAAEPTLDIVAAIGSDEVEAAEFRFKDKYAGRKDKRVDGDG